MGITPVDSTLTEVQLPSSTPDLTVPIAALVEPLSKEETPVPSEYCEDP